MEALRAWDLQHREAFLAWARDPWCQRTPGVPFAGTSDTTQRNPASRPCSLDAYSRSSISRCSSPPSRRCLPGVPLGILRHGVLGLVAGCRFRRSRAVWNESIFSTQSLPKSTEWRDTESNSVCRHAVFVTSDNGCLSEGRGPRRPFRLFLSAITETVSSELFEIVGQPRETADQAKAEERIPRPRPLPFKKRIRRPPALPLAAWPRPGLCPGNSRPACRR